MKTCIQSTGAPHSNQWSTGFNLNPVISFKNRSNSLKKEPALKKNQPNSLKDCRNSNQYCLNVDQYWSNVDQYWRNSLKNWCDIVKNRPAFLKKYPFRSLMQAEFYVFLMSATPPHPYLFLKRSIVLPL